MFASIIIVLLALLFGSLSIFAQYTKDHARREKLVRVVSIPAGLALYGSISWLMRHAHRLDELNVSPITLMIALAFFILIPAVTYIFSPAFKDAEDNLRQPQNHSQNYTTQQRAQWDAHSQRQENSSSACHSVCVDDTFIIEGVVVDEVDVHTKFLETSHS